MFEVYLCCPCQMKKHVYRPCFLPISNYTFNWYLDGAECPAMADMSKIHENENYQIFNGLMAFVMGIFTMVRMTQNMPKKLPDTDANIISNSVICDDHEYNGEVPSYEYNVEVPSHEYNEEVPSDELPDPPTALSPAEFMTVMKRMAELEEKMINMNQKPAALPPEKEQMLNTAISRADDLEKQLMATKKVNTFIHAHNLVSMKL